MVSRLAFGFLETVNKQAWSVLLVHEELFGLCAHLETIAMACGTLSQSEFKLWGRGTETTNTSPYTIKRVHRKTDGGGGARD